MNQPARPPSSAASHPSGADYLLGAGLYTFWGLVAIYLKMLSDVWPVEVLLHRILWSVLFLMAVVLISGRMNELRRAISDHKTRMFLLPAAIMVSVNWIINIAGVAQNHILAISIGYFLTPLVNIGLGVAVLRERASRAQMIAIAIATAGVAILATAELKTLWISLSLAVSFGLYGLLRKVAPVGAIVAATIEMIFLLPLAIVWLAWLQTDGTAAFGRDMQTSMLLVGCGFVLTVPILLFGVVVRRLTLIALGLLQFIAPTVQFLLALLVYHEPLSPQKLASFLLIWTGLLFFVHDIVMSARARRVNAVV